MNPVGGAKGVGKSLGRIVLRALISTVLIGAAAAVIIALRAGEWRWAGMKAVFTRNGALWVLIFFALVIWDGWFERSRRMGRRIISERG